MKKPLKEKFYKKFGDLEITDELIIAFLKEEDEYDDFYDIKIQEIRDFISRVDDKNRRVKEFKTKQKIYTLKSLQLKESTIYAYLREEIKNKVIVNKSNFESIISKFDYFKKPIDQFKAIDLNEFFYFEDIRNYSFTKDEVNKIYLNVKGITVYLNIFDLINIIYGERKFMNQVIKIENLLKYEEFTKKQKEQILLKNNKNLEIFKLMEEKTGEHCQKTYKRIELVYKFILTQEYNVFNSYMCVNNTNYLFLGVRQISKELNISIKLVQNAIKILSFCGLIELIQYDNFTEEEVNAINKNNKYNNVNIFKVNQLTQEHIEKLVNFRFSPEKINKEFIVKNFPNLEKKMFQGEKEVVYKTYIQYSELDNDYIPFNS